MEGRDGGASQPERPGVLVTGSARGIGRACAMRFAAEGWVVGALDVATTRLTDLARTSEAVVPLVADVADEPAVRAATRELHERCGHVCACVNAAGIYPVSTLETADSQLYRQIYDVNVLGTLLVAQAVADSIPADRPGAIVNFASSDAYVPKPSQILYGSAKAAVVHLTRTMAATLAPRRIRVNAVAPGAVDTEGMRANGDRLEQSRARAPFARVADPAEIAALVWWLVTGEGAQYITGETIVASGGLVMR